MSSVATETAPPSESGPASAPSHAPAAWRRHIDAVVSMIDTLGDDTAEKTSQNVQEYIQSIRQKGGPWSSTYKGMDESEAKLGRERLLARQTLATELTNAAPGSRLSIWNTFDKEGLSRVDQALQKRFTDNAEFWKEELEGMATGADASSTPEDRLKSFMDSAKHYSGAVATRSRMKARSASSSTSEKPRSARKRAGSQRSHRSSSRFKISKSGSKRSSTYTFSPSTKQSRALRAA